MTTYSDLLRDPRWQKKRLEIMQRDGFHCVQCGDGQSTLHVHHCYYIFNLSPWDYENTSLVTLCQDCHTQQGEIKEMKKLLSDALSIKGVLRDGFEELAHNIAFCPHKRFDEYIISALSWMFRTPGELDTILERYRRELANKREERSDG